MTESDARCWQIWLARVESAVNMAYLANALEIVEAASGRRSLLDVDSGGLKPPLRDQGVCCEAQHWVDHHTTLANTHSGDFQAASSG
ncbi:MAG: hypothetical protein ACRC1H_03715 [Caldilineaceae bacterium]